MLIRCLRKKQRKEDKKNIIPLHLVFSEHISRFLFFLFLLNSNSLQIREIGVVRIWILEVPTRLALGGLSFPDI